MNKPTDIIRSRRRNPLNTEITGLEFQSEYKAKWHKFMKGEKVDSLPSSLILESWDRCRDYGVDPMQKNAQDTLSIEELQKRRQKNQCLIETSVPMLKYIYEYLEGSGFTVALSDCDGYIIELFGDKKVCGLSQRGKWMSGVGWSEKSAGTNVIGTSIETDHPTSLTGYECYCHYSLNWSGAGAPIHDSAGKIIGVVGLAGLIQYYNPHTLGMVIAVAKAIEIQFAIKLSLEQVKIVERHKSMIIDSIYEGILVTGKDGVISLANKRSQEILQCSSDDLEGKHIEDLFSPYLIKNIQKDLNPIIDVQDEISFNNHKVKCTLTCQHIVVNDEDNGMLIVINEMERAKKLADKVLNKTAKTFENIIGSSAAFRETVELAKTVAPLKNNILLLGDSGTGKDLFAQAIHNESMRRLGPFVAINCGAIPRELIGSELFGYEDGAFTGASRGGKIGKFEMANGGTLFFDEIGELLMEQQKVFLRVLEERKVMRVGGNRVVPIDVRIIAATNKNLESEVARGNFRADLYYRLNNFTIRLLPLKERKSDIKPLATAFLKKITEEMDLEDAEVTDEAWDLLHNYPWPGNIRELQNVLERAVILSRNRPITAKQFDILRSGKSEESQSDNLSVKEELNQYEAELLENLLRKNNWNITKTCLELGISRTTLYRKIRMYNIEVPAK